MKRYLKWVCRVSMRIPPLCPLCPFGCPIVVPIVQDVPP